MPRYSTDFKEQAVCLFHQVGISKACKELHVTRATLYRWNKELSEPLSVSKLEDLVTLNDNASETTTSRIDSLCAVDKRAYNITPNEFLILQSEMNAQINLNRKLIKALIAILTDQE